MPDMTEPRLYSRSPACEGKVMIIEVMGTEHPDPYSLRLFDETDQQQQVALEQNVYEQVLDWQTLHVRPWNRQSKVNVWLEIAAESGNPVRVPLFREVADTPRQFDHQWNRVWPVVPLTLMHDSDPLPGHPSEHPLLVRPGYLYVFREGQLWRELEVKNSDAGELQFHDVRLSDYREPGMPGLTEDRRPAVGDALSAIWLPVTGMNQTLTSEFELAFSEVQWSAERVAYLESDAAARAERCDTWRGPEPPPPQSTIPTQRLANGYMVSTEHLPPMRLREPFLEQRLPQPWKSVYDLTGNHASNLYGQAQEEQQAFAAGGESAEDAWEVANYRDARLRRAPAARAAAFLAAKDNEEDDSEGSVWAPLATAEDALAKAKARHYAGLILTDPLFRVRHHLTQSLEAQRYLTGVLEAVDAAPNSDSAQLVQRVMGPERLGGRENPLHEYLDNIDTGLFSPLHRELLTAQRRLAAEELALAQKQLADLMRQSEYQTVMADLFSLTCADYIEGFAVTRDLFQALAVDPNRIDPLACSAVADEAQIRDANELILSIVQEGSDQPLHRMLIPGDDSGEGKALEAAGECGDGRCRPDDLANLPHESPDDTSLQTLTAASLAAVAKSNELNLTTEAKRWAAAVNAILDSLDQQIRALVQRLKRRTFDISGRLYGPLLRMAKAREPSLLGSVQLVARNAIPQGWLMFGVYDPESGLRFGLTEGDREYIHKGNGHRRFYGEFYDADGNPLASTRKSAIPDIGETAEVRNMRVYAAPADAEVVKNYRAVRLRVRWQEWAEAIRIPYLVLALEMTNLWQEGNLFQRTLARKGRVRAATGFISAAADLTVAGIFAAERLGKDVGVWKNLSNGLNKETFKTTHPVFQRLFPTLAKALPEVVTRRLLGGTVTGGLAMTVSLLDMGLELDTGDYDAAAAYGISAVGGGMTLMGGLIMANMAEVGVAPILLGLGPGVWVAIGLTLAIGAGMAAIMLDDPPLLEWLKRGPFGDEQDDAYSHLTDNPKETYYRLVGLLTKPRITIEHAHDVQLALLRQGYDIGFAQERQLSRINTMVRVENNLPAFLDEPNLEVRMRPIRITQKLTRRGLRTKRELLEEPAEVLLEQPLPSGKAYYLALPPRETFKTFLGGEGYRSSKVTVRAQWQCELNFQDACHNLVFPAPDLDHGLIYDLALHGEPDFAEVGQPFWADEHTYTPEES